LLEPDADDAATSAPPPRAPRRQEDIHGAR
jgi:hypothetical protein